MSFRSAATAAVLAAGLLLGGSGAAFANSDADGVAAESPGVISGNVIQVPVHIPLNVCGNTVDVLIAALNPAFGNVCANTDTPA
ncbi:hypothetical protein GCM10010387_04140 [Streptomyces inusitatus]|uniref:Chaplin domain-containing protein n=1 Tax=Streptomyces inusitatus TaxID=68221 RepID=A0A918UJT6_9ACTN|nr:chaplin [Streptomyces inusitatus]GGZ15032.1 hypothetical protein GCM10010387_04140 [Streptomyces inusitatus]